MYLDYAENQAQRNIKMTMRDWIEKLGAFLQFNEYDILQNSGTVSQEVAKKIAENNLEYGKIKNTTLTLIVLFKKCVRISYANSTKNIPQIY